MGYNFRELFYYLFQNKKNTVFAFDSDKTVQTFCILFYLDELKVTGINRLLDDKVMINLIDAIRSAGLSPIIHAYQKEIGIASSTDLNIFRDSFNRPSLDRYQLQVEINDTNYSMYDLIIIKETLTRTEYHQVIARNKRMNLPVFLTWVESAQNLGEIFPDAMLVEAKSGKKSSLQIKSIVDGKVIETREIKQK